MDTKTFTLAELAEYTRSSLIGDPDYLISGVDAIDSASAKDASFLANPRYRSLLKTTQAGVVCIDRNTLVEEGKNYLVSDDPSIAFQIIAEKLLQASSSGFSGVHPTAVIHPQAKLGKNVTVGPYVVIDQGAEIGDQTRLAPFVYIGAQVKIGKKCLIHSHVAIRERCRIGDRVILQPGAVIGSCGFGYATNAQGQHTKLEQLGIVVIDDDVEIGANTTIDRARFQETRIGRGTKIDNLVQIGHNVVLGQDNIIVSQTGIAGSSKTGKHVIMGGQAGVVGHVEITDNVMIATRGGVSKSLTQPGKYAGGPVMPLSDYNKQQVQLRKISEYVEKIEELEKRLRALESSSFISN
ncbi:MAG TPA: UDP-3-O-(3-hydroxymyristoyl)glucosamine N-acyltransferase [Rhabdochlamydiaceae bacterium]|jgi:UDP-3-O-[3-hydroxymyristoyl] glucosamine N-acyltransferase